MKVLLISTVPMEKNGISKCVLSYYAYLDRNVFDIDLLVPNTVNDRVSKEIITTKTGHLFEIPFRKKRVIKYFITLCSIIRKGKYDIVHVNGNSCTMAIELMAALISGCRVRAAHSHNTTCDHQVLHRVLRPFFELSCNMRLACGEQAGEWLYKKKNFLVVQNGIDIECYKYSEKSREEVRQKLDITKNQVLLGNIGTLSYQKNQEFLIALLDELLKKSNRNYKLLIIGDGSNRQKICQDIKRKGLEDSVVIIKSTNCVQKYLSAMDIFVLPSRFEGVPIVAVEAQASGLPCVLSDKISKEIELSRNVRFLPIDHGVDGWRMYIDSIKPEVRTGKEQLSNQKYELKNAIDLLEKIYIEQV